MVMPLVSWSSVSSFVGVSACDCETEQLALLAAASWGNEVDVWTLFQPVCALPSESFAAVML